MEIIENTYPVRVIRDEGIVSFQCNACAARSVEPDAEVTEEQIQKFISGHKNCHPKV